MPRRLIEDLFLGGSTSLSAVFESSTSSTSSALRWAQRPARPDHHAEQLQSANGFPAARDGDATIGNRLGEEASRRWRMLAQSDGSRTLIVFEGIGAVELLAHILGNRFVELTSASESLYGTV